MGEFRQQQLLRVAAALSFLLALLNHLLPPKAFSATQLLFDYEFGLARRGLFGELLNLVTGAQVTVTEVYATAALLSFAGAAGFYLFLSRYMLGQVSGYLVLILALNTFAFSSFVGSTGYLDAALLGVTLLALSTDARQNIGLLLRLALCVVGVLIHENMLPYFTVLIGLDLWLARKDLPLAFPIAISPVLAGLISVAALAAFAGFSPEQAVSYAEYLQGKAAFGLDPTSTDVAGRTIGDNFALMRELRGTTKYWAWVMFDGLPLLGMSLWLIWLALKVLGDAADRPTRVFLLAAVMAPLSLNIIAFDVVRFGAASVLSGFLVLVLLTRYVPGSAGRLEQVLGWTLFLLVLVLNVNMFTIQVNVGAGHTSQFPWVILTQLQWLAP